MIALIVAWFKAPGLAGIPHWGWATGTTYAFLEWWLGFNKDKTRSASAVAAIANLLGVVLRRVPGLGLFLDVIGRPGAGPSIVIEPVVIPPKENP